MYKPKSIKIALIVLFISVIYVITFALIESKAEDQQFKTFEVVTGLSGLLLSAVGAIYVYNAYEAQREQIKLQKEEIERNRLDVEFNRVVDILYRQLEVSSKFVINKYYSRLKKEFYDPENPFRDTSYHFDFFEREYSKVLHYVIDVSHAFETLELILTKNNLTDEQHLYLEQILLSIHDLLSFVSHQYSVLEF